MTIKKLYVIIYSIIGVVLLSLGVMISLVLENQKRLNQSQLARYQSYLLVSELKQSSEELTTMARTYVASKDAAYEQKYWDILAVRNGQKPRPDGRTISLKKLMQEAGFTADEFAKLQEAEDKSNALVQTEALALNAIKGLYPDGKGNFVQRNLPSDSLGGGETPSDQAYALDLLFNEAYHQNKARIMKPINEFVQMLTERTDHQVEVYVGKGDRYLVILVTLFLVLLVVIVFSYLAIQQKVISRLVLLTQLTQNAQRISAGDFSSEVQITSGDEIGQLAKAVQGLSEGLKEKAAFAQAIGQGNLEAGYQPLGEKDALGYGLLEMRDNLRKMALEDQKRQWAAEGSARFADILRSTHHTQELGDHILSNLVKYVEANQAALFIVTRSEATQDASAVRLEMLSCYAYNRKKYIGQSLAVGEGLVGQAYLEKASIYMTDVPNNYVRITSGLGDATPRCLLIVPLQINEQVEGVVELAFFHTLEPHVIAFVEKLAETIAGTLVSIRTNERTQQLLNQSQQQAEAMRAQEEELRQNLEELAATQEETHRKERRYLERIAELEKENVE